MVSQPARPLRTSRQKSGKSAKSARSSSAPAQLLKIGEAARTLGVEAYVLRFWETQFPDLRPYHTATRHRLYSAQDIEILQLIKHLLYDQGFTIEGARKRIRELAQAQKSGKAAVNSAGGKTKTLPAPGAEPNHAPGAQRQVLIDIRRDLESIYQMLKH